MPKIKNWSKAEQVKKRYNRDIKRGRGKGNITKIHYAWEKDDSTNHRVLVGTFGRGGQYRVMVDRVTGRGRKRETIETVWYDKDKAREVAVEWMRNNPRGL